MLLLNFFGGEIINSDYIEGNIEYAKDYKIVLNDNITSKQNGYVPLSRILKFYYEDDKLLFSNIYSDNLDYQLRTIKPLSDVCIYPYTSFETCSDVNDENDYPYKPFNNPINFKDVYITSFFGEERIVFDEYDIHYGWDFACMEKTPVYSVYDGIVRTIRFNQDINETDKNNGAGNYIEIDYEIDDLIYTVLYGHLYPNSFRFKVGDKVKAKDIIALVGTTGYSTGNHLHFQVKVNGKLIDGMNLIDFTLNN